MYCPKCGREIPEGSTFCMHCGADLSEYKVEISPKAEDTREINEINGLRSFYTTELHLSKLQKSVL